MRAAGAAGERGSFHATDVDAAREPRRAPDVARLRQSGARQLEQLGSSASSRS